MALEQVPYTNYHDLNLDWVLKVTKEAEDIIAGDRGEIADIKEQLEQAVTSATESAQAASTSAQSAANANVNALFEANRAATSAEAASAAYTDTLMAIDNFADSVASATSDWLDNNVDPATGYVLDTSLTVAGAAADAKAAGDRIGEVETLASSTDLRVDLVQIGMSRITSNIADLYDNTIEYVPGDYCIYDDLLKLCTAATTGEFDATKWETVTVISQVGQGGGATDSYTKAQTNALLAQKVDNTYLASNYYDKPAVDTLVSDKVSNSTLGNYYTKSETDSALSGKVNNATLNNYYNKTETDDLLDNKADTSDFDDYYTKAEVNAIFAGAVNPYPVGSIYMSVNSTSPATLFGGTWQRIQDCFLLAAGSTYAAGATGGEAEHTLTINEMPSHSHDSETWSYRDGSLYNWFTTSPGSHVDWKQTTINNTGGGAAHNNMPPYLAVYVWQRTA